MAERQLILTCSVAGARDTCAVQRLLLQYGLDAQNLGREIVARGEVPTVLVRMKDVDLEQHLAQRIEDAAPGTRVTMIKARIVDP